MTMFVVDSVAGTVVPIKHETCPLLSAAARMHEELEDWKEYKKLAHESKTPTHTARHQKVAEQEFNHAMIALEDVLDYLREHCSSEELSHLHKALMAK